MSIWKWCLQVIAGKREGFPIVVSSIPKETTAWYSLRDPSEVLAFLLRLAKWNKSQASFLQLDYI